MYCASMYFRKLTRMDGAERLLKQIYPGNGVMRSCYEPTWMLMR
jgi:hypothetical protein